MKKFIVILALLGIVLLPSFAEANAVSRLSIRNRAPVVRQRIVNRIQIAPIRNLIQRVRTARAINAIRVDHVAIQQIHAVPIQLDYAQYAQPVIARIVYPPQALQQVYAPPIIQQVVNPCYGATGQLIAPLTAARTERITEKIDAATGKVIERIVER